MKGTLEMVFARYGSSEQYEDAVPGILHVAIIVLGSIDHYFQSWVDDRARLLRIEVLLEIGRAFDVGNSAVTILRSP